MFAVGIPLILAVAIAVAALGWAAYRRWLRRPAGLCLDCGYHLRRSWDRCPACGRAAGD
jgi:hypothetical protein